MRLQNYIGGKWIDARRGTFATTVDPADRRTPLAEYTLSHPEDVDDAVAAAKAALPEWRALPAPKRGRVLMPHKSIQQFLIRPHVKRVRGFRQRLSVRGILHG